jgi:hypothetical protein
MTTIVVSGALANKPFNGGEAWVRLNWILGFQRLGCEVYFVEQIDRGACVDDAGTGVPFTKSINLAYFRHVIEQFGLTDRAVLIYQDGEAIYGLDEPALFSVAKNADLLVNISGHLTWEPLLHCFQHKIYIDIDPGFTQFWHADPASDFQLRDHDAYFTIGENIGAADCPIPTGGIAWKQTRQPVVLEQWPVCTEISAGRKRERFTTIASWRGGYGPVYVGDKVYGLKVHEFRNFVALPQHSPYTFEIALQIHPNDHKDLVLLQSHGWQIVDPTSVAFDPFAFRHYIQRSAAEFSVAQSIYVETNSGWFSDRSVRYLASGKPALVQDTDFSRNYPVGEGLIPFRTMEEAIGGAEAIVRDYERHARAARALAESCFDSDKVLMCLLNEVALDRKYKG